VLSSSRLYYSRILRSLPSPFRRLSLKTYGTILALPGTFSYRAEFSAFSRRLELAPRLIADKSVRPNQTLTI